MIVVLATLCVATLTLEDILESVSKHYPKVRAAQQKIQAAEGLLTSSRGDFDLKIDTSGGLDPTGYYQAPNADFSLNQMLPFGGIKLGAGYRWGEDLPPYDGKRWTSNDGEAYVKLHAPLLRDRAIDESRLRVMLSQLGVEIAELEAARLQLDVWYEASLKYWKWVATGQELKLRERLLALAEQRERAAIERVARGDAPEIARIDAETFSLSRRETVQEVTVALEVAALDLSVYWRTNDGDPRLPGPDQLPMLPEPTGSTPDLDNEPLRLAFSRRPVLQVFVRERRALEQDLALSSNERLPTLNLELKGSQDFGERGQYGSSPTDITRNESELMITLTGSFPIQQRKARGKQAAVRAKLRELEEELRLVRDLMKAEVNATVTTLKTAHSRAQLAKRAQELSLKLESAERRKFDLGQSNILFLLAREEFSADASVKYIKANLDLQWARAAYERALALRLQNKVAGQ